MLDLLASLELARDVSQLVVVSKGLSPPLKQHQRKLTRCH